MKSTLRGLLIILLLATGIIAQAQEAGTETANPLLETFGIGLVFAFVGLMLAVLLYFVFQLWEKAKEEQNQALTDKVQVVPAIPAASSVREAHGTSPYIPLPAETDDAPTMLLELVQAPANSRLHAGQQWFISQNRSPFIIGSGTDENKELDILLDSGFVSSFHLKIEFEAPKQRFVLIDTDSLNGTVLNDSRMAAYSRYPIPVANSVLIEVAHQYVFSAVQVKGNPVVEPNALPEINLGDEVATELVETIASKDDFVATSKLPDVAELEDELMLKASTGEVATLQEAPDMSNITGVRYPLQNVDYPPLARLPEEIDAMIEVLRSPQAEPTTYTIWRTVYHVGRGDRTDLRIPGALISNNHFSIYWTKNSFWIIDTSLNQTWLRWDEHEQILERGTPTKLEMGRDYKLILARDDTMLRFRYVLNKPETDAKEITLPPLPTAIKPKLKLVRLGKTEEEKDFAVGSNRITIGRESGNLVQLDPQVVSRRHAEIVWKADAYYLRDKGSLYGVSLDEALIPSGGERRLEAGKTYNITLSPKQRDSVLLEFSYSDRRTSSIE